MDFMDFMEDTWSTYALSLLKLLLGSARVSFEYCRCYCNAGDAGSFSCGAKFWTKLKIAEPLILKSKMRSELER